MVLLNVVIHHLTYYLTKGIEGQRTERLIDCVFSGFQCSGCKKVFASSSSCKDMSLWKKAVTHKNFSRNCKGMEIISFYIPFRASDATVGGSGSACVVYGEVFSYLFHLCPS